MADRFDFELRALEADIHAERSREFARVESWRDIAHGYRMLSDFLAHEQVAQLYQEGTSLSERPVSSTHEQLGLSTYPSRPSQEIYRMRSYQRWLAPSEPANESITQSPKHRRESQRAVKQ